MKFSDIKVRASVTETVFYVEESEKEQFNRVVRRANIAICNLVVSVSLQGFYLPTADFFVSVNVEIQWLGSHNQLK